VPDPGEDILTELRKKMTEVTAEFVAAFNRRGSLALAIAQEKARLRAPQVRDLKREAEVLQYASSVSKGPFSAEAVQRIVQAAMDEASALQAAALGIPIENGKAKRRPKSNA
jgi:chorismate mutase